MATTHTAPPVRSEDLALSENLFINFLAAHIPFLEIAAPRWLIPLRASSVQHSFHANVEEAL